MATLTEESTTAGLADAPDPDLDVLVATEEDRRARQVNLLAGENDASPRVLALLGSVFADKYAEGYPERRHHTGCGPADSVESLAVARAEALFGAQHANVQPYSGSIAVLAAAAALLRPGDAVLAMSLAHGGHLTHGSSANFSGKWFSVSGYGVSERDGLIDLDQVRDQARALRPKVIVAGAISYPRAIDWEAFRSVADEVGAYLVADAAQTLGLSAAGVIPSPVPYADIVCGVTHKVLGGPRGGLILSTRELAERVDRAVFPFIQGGPMVNQMAAKAYTLGRAATPAFAQYAQQTVRNAQRLAAALDGHGLRPLTGGTDTHLVTVDARSLGLTGREVERRCEEAGLLLGHCAVPYEEAPPAAASGLRMGTLSVTTRGMGEPEMSGIAGLVHAAATGATGPARESVTEGVRALAERFPGLSTKPQCGDSASG
ncbi:serine hydroxymethyltransferase [Streptacidiphilus jiangxiensis]|uniref:Serine hydroxymethyltransferase n=1 Tax=Streptacidiphilus jiangxiensis TaxID=235985 RepID=A0A1H7G6P7_STRJI|nr:serine hydroxymethyltransferase [Streptacidiphilus jiangxiensis]SEK33809.1 glycine hydroxymethyltransferase [Streptacidiphilus jiangxiensis]